MTEVMKTPPPSAFSPHLRPSDGDRSNHRRSNRQQRSYSRQPSTDREESDDELREPSEWDYPDQALQRHMELLDEKRTANLERLNNIFELQKENLKKMTDAFEYQAWEDFAVRTHPNRHYLSQFSHRTCSFQGCHYVDL
ncbi:hypothetical protein INT44_008809 [Umbelopsis vinacea]|uniref:Uncharacterized protein n=1 Tax=Umbelopsis vinacea TaxID=44442 RepID=A0A8H7PGD2_9FUNG|nr:hypothetical protein INT44_008809 [Umbelopsis vinacea]